MKQFPMPELIHWKSFDGRKISGFLYRPTKPFPGKRPVIIDIHGGPEDQHRPGYSRDDSYFINEMGIVKIYPNVRGSTGYGRTFRALDNGLKRENAVKDIGTLLAWVKTQPDLDHDQIMVQGASYGGYLALSSAIAFSDQIKGVMSECGISNFLTTIQGTREWRKPIQRAEYGNERDQKIKKFMELTAPVNNSNKIKMPLFIIHGKNDPRVPYKESESIVTAAKKSGIIVWYILANDEGHGIYKSPNYEYMMCSLALFLKEHILKEKSN